MRCFVPVKYSMTQIVKWITTPAPAYSPETNAVFMGISDGGMIVLKDGSKRVSFYPMGDVLFEANQPRVVNEIGVTHKK